MPDDLKYAGFCHCSECRKFSGSAFSAFGGVPTSVLRVLKGADSIKHYKKTEETILGFCSVCGSSLYAQKPTRGMVHLRLGTLIDEPSMKPRTHSFIGSKAPWYEITDDLPQFETTRAAGNAS